MPSSSLSSKKPNFYTHRDLTSDYYQALIQKGRPKWCKILWLLLTFALLGTTVYLIYRLMKEYLEYNSFNKTSVKWEKTVPLPAITVCSTNFINYTDFQMEITNDTLTGNLADLVAKIDNFNGKGSILDYIDKSWVNNLDAKWKDKNGNEVNIFEDYQFEPASFLLGDGDQHFHIKFAGVWQKLDVVTVEHENGTKSVGRDVQSHQFGKCIALNDDQSMVQVLGGPEGGLTIDLNARVSDYLPSTKTKGFMVYLRSPYETVLTDAGGILVSPGTETFISLSKTKVTRLPPKYGSCENVTSKFVPTIAKTVRECIQEENLRLAVEECNCVPWYLKNRLTELNLTSYMTYWYELQKENADEEVDTSEECGFATQSLCNSLVLAKIVKTIGNESTCPEPCSFLRYDWSLKQGMFPPTEKYWELLLKDVVSVEDEVKEKKFTFAEENYARINIYYEDIKVTEMEQEKAYEIFNFIAEFGGTVDMMISFSFFTVFQVCELVIVWFCYRGARAIGKEDSVSDVGNIELGRKEQDDNDGVFSKISGVFK